MSDYTYNSFPIPAKPLSGVGETSYLSALLGIAPGGVKKVPTASFLAAAGVYPVALLQCTPQITQVIGDVAANTTLIPLIADTTVSGGDTGVSTGGMSVGDTSPNAGKIVISEAGLYRVSCSIRITRTSSDGGECGAVIKKNGSSVITSVYDEADTDDHFTLTCPTVIASLASGDVLSLNAAIVGGSSESIYVNGASLLPEDVPTPTSVVLVERLNSASGDSSSTESLAELAAEVEDAREGYDGTEYASLGAAIRSQVEAAMQSGGGGITEEVKQALLDCFAHVAWVDEYGQSYYDALSYALYSTTWRVTNTLTNCITSNSLQTVNKGSAYSASITANAGYTLTGAVVSILMNGADITSQAYDDGSINIASVTGDLVITVIAVETQAEVVSISATYTQSGEVYATTPLDDLKPDLVVVATYDDSSSAVVAPADYTLSGTLTTGTSTITVTFEGKTTTFNVTVSAEKLYLCNTVSSTVTTAITAVATHTYELYGYFKSSQVSNYYKYATFGSFDTYPGSIAKPTVNRLVYYYGSGSNVVTPANNANTFVYGKLSLTSATSTTFESRGAGGGTGSATKTNTSIPSGVFTIRVNPNVYWHKIVEKDGNEDVVAEYTAQYDNNNVPCMYESVSGVYYYPTNGDTAYLKTQDQL